MQVRLARGREALAFEVKSTNAVSNPGEQDYLASRFTDDVWRNVLVLARRHGFDSTDEYGNLMYPKPGETGEMGLAATQELALALSEVLREETAPSGEVSREFSREETREEGESGQKGWVYEPERGWEWVAVIPVGPADNPERRVGWVHVRQLGELAESGSLRITRVEDPPVQEMGNVR